MEHAVCILLLVGTVFSSTFDEQHMRTRELILHNGYPVETHKVHTDDGYILTMYRIPHGVANSTTLSNKQKDVFYIQHGLLGSSYNFVTNLPRHSLAFTLVDEGYDVWLGNTRGNSYSTEHQFLSVDSEEYWDFSHDDMAKYDFPAMVNHALKISHQKQLYYVGHSQGTLISFARLSEDKTLQKKIKGIFALAPVAQMAHVSYPLKLSAQLSLGFQQYIDKLHIKNPLPIIRELVEIQSSIREQIRQFICMVKPALCKLVTFNSTDLAQWIALRFNSSDLVFSEFPLYRTHIPDGTSMKNLYHYAQLVDSGRFQKYDYGWLGNLIWYASLTPPYYSLTPPQYELGNINVPIVLFSGSKDILSVTEDVRWINKQLPNVLHNIVIPEYDHLSFEWSKTANQKVYKKIVRIARSEMR